MRIASEGVTIMGFGFGFGWVDFGRTGRDKQLPLGLGQLVSILGRGECDFDLGHVWLEACCSYHI